MTSESSQLNTKQSSRPECHHPRLICRMGIASLSFPAQPYLRARMRSPASDVHAIAHLHLRASGSRNGTLTADSQGSEPPCFSLLGLVLRVIGAAGQCPVGVVCSPVPTHASRRGEELIGEWLWLWSLGILKDGCLTVDPELSAALCSPHLRKPRRVYSSSHKA